MIHIQNDYFNWLCSMVKDEKPKGSYYTLLKYLHGTEFTFILPMDENRCADGADLRYRFGDEKDIDGPIIASCLDDRPCSILEMMVALSLRCEEGIMVDLKTGAKPGRWFWKMIDNMGLLDMTDDKFDDDYVNGVVWRFLSRDYEPDGRGSIAYIPNTQYDMRTMEIWYQIMHFLTEYLRNGV